MWTQLAAAGRWVACSADRLAPCTCPPPGAHAGGKLGHRLVVTFALIELFGGSCIVLLVVWQQLVLFLPAAGELGARVGGSGCQRL